MQDDECRKGGDTTMMMEENATIADVQNSQGIKGYGKLLVLV